MKKTKDIKPKTSKDDLPHASLDKVAGGGNQPTATIESTGSIKTL
ncbi:hypothetical protein [Devosia sp. Leaf64]|nr:hypothetical protein [Devosia sp. Leaf64]